MARCFDGQLAVDSLFVQFDGFIDNVPIASSVPEVFQSEFFLNEFRQLAAGDAVRHDSRARVLLRHQGRGHGHDAVSGDLASAAVHRRGTVHIRVEDEPEICAASYRL